ncbi:amino acid permease [Yersinia aleksiciae]|uniref:Amino acid permease family protein n=1 Tax=Yersinia aleksiciae TaxID=263819 RepID=A0A0T9T7V2_YERAE|nr:amino acid permease [Yersinia aleksiciae]CNK66898.1 amino acid permease family protein [Yersinia aleksiciae]
MELNRSLKPRHLTMISIGGVIGAGFFLGAGSAISQTGTSVVLAYLIGGIITLFVMMLLAEMAVANPVSGSFQVYAKAAFGPYFGFITGWTYWFAFLIGPASEAIAAGTFLNIWFPEIPIWMFCLIVASSLTIINMIGVHFFGEVEFWLSLVKVVALLSFIIIALYALGYKDNVSLSNFSNSNSNFFAYGLYGFIGSMLMVVFSFGGTEAIGTAAGESENPEKDIPKTIKGTMFRIIFLYVISITLLLCVLPWEKAGVSSSPYVDAFGILGGPFAKNIMNFVVLTAALSCIDTGVYATSRMLYSLSNDGYFPKWFSKINQRHRTPNNAIFCSSLILFLGAVLAIFSPRAYTILASISGFGFIFTWLMIALSQKKLRAKHGNSNSLKYKAPFAGIIQPITVISLLFILFGQAFVPGGWISLVAGFGWILLSSIYYFVHKSKVK